MKTIFWAWPRIAVLCSGFNWINVSPGESSLVVSKAKQTRNRKDTRESSFLQFSASASIFIFDKRLPDDVKYMKWFTGWFTGCRFGRWVWLTDDWPMEIHYCLPFADERRSVKCLGSAAGVSFPSPPLPPAPTFFLPFAQYPRAIASLGLKEKETTATQAIKSTWFFKYLLIGLSNGLINYYTEYRVCIYTDLDINAFHLWFKGLIIWPPCLCDNIRIHLSGSTNYIRKHQTAVKLNVSIKKLSVHFF